MADGPAPLSDERLLEIDRWVRDTFLEGWTGVQAGTIISELRGEVHRLRRELTRLQDTCGALAGRGVEWP